jgi:hypothetical protein
LKLNTMISQPIYDKINLPELDYSKGNIVIF